jgi:hypothetical protein
MVAATFRRASSSPDLPQTLRAAVTGPGDDQKIRVRHRHIHRGLPSPVDYHRTVEELIEQGGDTRQPGPNPIPQRGGSGGQCGSPGRRGQGGSRGR